MRLPAAISNKLRCWSFYAFGCYRGTGGRLKYIAEDWSEVRLELPLSWRTRNYVGTIFGGSIYSSVDPIYMLMLIHRLRPGVRRVGQRGRHPIQKTGPRNSPCAICSQ
jgi:acyl-coenzyme A thioesterase PaaI-like protein